MPVFHCYCHQFYSIFTHTTHSYTHAGLLHLANGNVKALLLERRSANSLMTIGRQSGIVANDNKRDKAGQLATSLVGVVVASIMSLLLLLLHVAKCRCSH